MFGLSKTQNTNKGNLGGDSKDNGKKSAEKKG